jgi:hypothetical protein
VSAAGCPHTGNRGAQTLGVVDVLTDDELTVLALAANPDAEVSDDAVSIWDLEPQGAAPTLPSWYMPAATAPAVHGWRRRVALLTVVSFLAVNAAGLCVTYGHVMAA